MVHASQLLFANPYAAFAPELCAWRVHEAGGVNEAEGGLLTMDLSPSVALSFGMAAAQ